MNQLLASIQIPLAQIHFECIKAIDNHDFSQVKKKVTHDHGVTDEAKLELGIEYLKRYYTLHVLAPQNDLAISKEVDTYWHAHVVYTKDYTHFCQQVYESYLHHLPLLLDDPVSRVYVEDLYEYTYGIHQEVFTDMDDKMLPKAVAKGLCCGSTNTVKPGKLFDNEVFPRRSSRINVRDLVVG